MAKRRFGEAETADWHKEMSKSIYSVGTGRHPSGGNPLFSYPKKPGRRDTAFRYSETNSMRMELFRFNLFFAPGQHLSENILPHCMARAGEEYVGTSTSVSVQRNQRLEHGSAGPLTQTLSPEGKRA